MTTQETITIEPLNIKTLTVRVGGNAMLMNKRDEATEQLLKEYWENAKKPKEKKRIKEEDIVDGRIYWIDKAKKRVGFPTGGFKRGMVEVCPRINPNPKAGGINKGMVRGTINVLGETGELAELKYKEMVINHSVGMIGSGARKTPKPTIRPEFRNWEAQLNISYNADVLSADQIIQLINWAGFHQGIGDWRPERGGSFGQYQVIPTNKNEKV